MASEALKKLEEQLNCSICLDTYTDPKLLRCFHVYCRQCLVPLVVRDQQGKLGLTCPTCRQVTPIPDRGVAGLQSAFHINHLLEIQESFQKLENPAATVEGEVGNMTIDAPSMRHCFEHAEEKLKLYCETCGELACFKCALKDGKHHSHDYEELNSAFEKYKEMVTLSLEPIEKQSMVIKRVLSQLDVRCAEISNQQGNIKGSIHVTFRQLHESLSARETELIGELDQMSQRKLKSLAAQRDQIETMLAQLSSCLHFLRESLRPGNEGDVLMMKPNTVKQVNELSTPFPLDILQPNTEANMVFSSLTAMTELCSNYGEVVSGLPDPLQCRITGSSEVMAVVGERHTVSLRAVDIDGKPCEDLVDSLDCRLTSGILGTRTNCEVNRVGQSQYVINYQPTVKGRHQVHVLIKGQHVRGSPFGVAVKSPVMSLGVPVLNISKVAGPWRVLINRKGEVMASEGGKHYISVFSSSGERLRLLGSQGSGPGEFEQPRGISEDGEGNVLVADCGNHRVQKFTADGQHLMSLGTEGNGHLQFSFPFDVAYNRVDMKIYVVDKENHRVQILNADYTAFGCFGRNGTGKGQFRRPCSIAFDSTGKVYVAEVLNSRIQVFTPEGKFLRKFGSRGCELERPNCVAIDSNDMVYVSERYKYRVSVFTCEGQFVTSFGSSGVGPGEFDFPRGIAVDTSGAVYMCAITKTTVFKYSKNNFHMTLIIPCVS